MKEKWGAPTFIDSGGFASLFKGSKIIDLEERSGIQTEDGTLTDPPLSLIPTNVTLTETTDGSAFNLNFDVSDARACPQ